ncbi:MAG: hypothetical protein L6R48_07180 [Planctomycetes bacterium]|nr:hypothetical protein [Planctomycetota bacterium]
MRRLIPLGLLLAVSLLFATPLGADGKAFSLNSDGRWMLAREDSQVAALHWAEGREHLAVAVRLELREGARGLWLLPVRGRVDEVRLDLREDFPVLRGTDPRQLVNDGIDYAAGWMTASQLWTIPFLSILIPNLAESRIGADGTIVRRFGLRSQVLALAPEQDLGAILAGLGAPVAGADLASLACYADGGHSLVATWIEDEEQAKDHLRRANGWHWPTVTVSFPSAEPWFPLRASRGQLAEGQQMPITVTVLGFHRATTHEMARVHHLVGTSSTDAFWPVSADSDVRFTRVTARLDDDHMAQDLTFAPFDPPRLEAALAVYRLPWSLKATLVLLLHLGLSALAGLIAGRSRQAARTGARYGLLNIATVFCVHLATRNHPQLGIRRAISFTFAFSVTYLALLGLCWLGAHLAFRPGGV